MNLYLRIISGLATFIVSSASFSQASLESKILSKSELTPVMECRNTNGGYDLVGITSSGNIYYAIDGQKVDAIVVGNWKPTMSDFENKIHISIFAVEGIEAPLEFVISDTAKQEMLKYEEIRQGAISVGGFDALMKISTDTIARTWEEFEVDFESKYYRIRLSEEVRGLTGQSYMTITDCN